MISRVVVALLACSAVVSAAPTVRLAVDQHLVDSINSNPKSTWTAAVNSRFENMPLENARKLMGTRLGVKNHFPTITETLENAPASFDSRTAWPGCIGPILNQGDCGSCWAFGAAESLSDRRCIEKQTPFLQLAALDLVECDGWDGGCEGGEPSSAFSYAQSEGLVTEECLPYLKSEGGPIATCPPEKQPCLPPFVQTPSCTQQCNGNTTKTYSQDKHVIRNAYNVPGDADAMAAELVKNGPFEVTMTVFQDFLSYKSGVYQHQSGQALGGHAIKVIGYGTENSLPYWLIANSWTTTWGDQGFFKILRGSNECGIEFGGVAGTW